MLFVELPTFDYPVLFQEQEYVYESHFQEQKVVIQEQKTVVIRQKQEPAMDPELSLSDATQKPIGTCKQFSVNNL